MIAVAEVIYLKQTFAQGRIKRKKEVIISNIPNHYNFTVYTKGIADKQDFFVAENNHLVLDKAKSLKSYASIIAVINIKSYWVEILDIITDTATAEEFKNMFENHKNVRKISKLF